MKKLLLTLLLITSTAFAQVPDAVDSQLSEIESIVESIREYYSTKEVPQTIEAHYINGDLIAVEWDAFKTTEDVDIEFYSPDLHEEWQHSVNKYLDLHHNPVDSQSGLYTIGGGNSSTDDVSWKIRMRVGDWVSEEVTLTPEERGPPSKSDIESRTVLTTLWDSAQNNFDTGFNAVRTRDIRQLRKMEGSGKIVIHSLSHTWETTDEDGKKVLKSRDEWRAQLRNFARELEDRNGYNDLNFRLFIQDEAMGKPWFGETPTDKVSNLEEILQIAREELPGWVKMGISETRGSYNRGNIAAGFDFYVEPAYYFFNRDLDAYGDGYFAIENRYQFDDRFQREIEITRNIIGDAELFIIGQGFYNSGDMDAAEYRRRWRQPPLWYAEALYENIYKYKVDGIWWWLYKSNEQRYYIGLDQMPEMFNQIKKITQ